MFLTRPWLWSAASTWLTLLFAVPVEGATLLVPSQHPTIQAAIGSALPGDEVLVSPGVYAENIDFLGKAIRVTSSGGPLVTTIDGSAGTGPVVRFQSGETIDSILEGFTITGGGAPPPMAPPPTGGAVAILFSAPTVQGNIMTENDVSSGAGGGVYLIASSGAVLRSNVIVDNVAGLGGGIHMQDCSNVTLTSNTIAGNSAFQAGGVSHLGSIGTQFYNNVVWNNSPEAINDTTGLLVHHCCVEGGWPGTANLTTDPEFIDAPNGNYRLSDTSPCVNMADPGAPALPGTDFEGDPRNLCGGVDIGADENIACLGSGFVRGDDNGDGMTNIADPVYNLAYLFQNGATLCLRAQDSNDDGQVNIGDPVFLLASLFGMGGPLPPPGPLCGRDPTPDALSCNGYAACP